MDGDDVTFTAVLTGEPAPEVKWYQDDEELTPNPDRSITFKPETGEATLVLYGVFPEDTAVYKIVATNPVGRATISANLIVQSKFHPLYNITISKNIV